MLRPECRTDNLESNLEFLESDAAYLEADQMNYGVAYYATLADQSVISSARRDVEKRAFAYTKNLRVQLATRLPENLKYFGNLKLISPKVILGQIRPEFKDLPFLDTFVKGSDLAVLESQYQMQAVDLYSASLQHLH